MGGESSLELVNEGWDLGAHPHPGHARLGRSKNPTFQPPSGWLATDEGGERTGDFGKLSALRGHKIAFGLTFTTPSGVRSTLFTRGRGAPLT